MEKPADQSASVREPWLFDQMPLSEFLATYWQKKPCLFRGALPNFAPALDANELAGLAMEEDLESRLIVEQPEHETPWAVHNGPFSEAMLTGLPDRHWSLLVQAVDQYVPEVATLLEYFKFLPRWRLDDIMISFAPEGGSVGPHFDQYDVFLVQATGHRRWQLGQVCDSNTQLLEGTALKILADFQPNDDQDWILAPGDVLYLPPALAHHGVAQDNCMTWSVGFRAPDVVETLHGLALRGDLEPDIEFLRFTDNDLSVAEATNPELTTETLGRVRRLLRQITERDEVLADWLGAFMTQNKYDLFDWDHIDSEAIDLPPDTRLRRALPTRFTAHGTRFYCNGRAFPLSPEDRPLICLLLTREEWTWQGLLDHAHTDTARTLLNLLVNSDSVDIVE